MAEFKQSSSFSNKINNYTTSLESSSIIFDKVNAAIYLCDINGLITYYNKAAIRLWNYEPELGKDYWFNTWRDFYADGKAINTNNLPMAICLREGIAVEEEVLVQCWDGTFKSLLVSPTPLFNNENELIGGINTLVDITEQKNYDRKQAMLAAIIQSSDDAIISKTLAGIITSWNAGAKRIFGYEESEVIGKHIEILIPQERRSEEYTIIDQLKKGNRVSHFETVRLTKEGKRLDISLTISPLKDKKGNIIGASKIARDITLQKQIEEANFEYAKRLEILNAVGRMISEKLDINDVLQKVTDGITKISGAEFGVCYYNSFNADGENIVVFAHSGEVKQDLISLSKKNAKFFNKNLSSNFVLRINDITQDLHFNISEQFYGNTDDKLVVKSYLSVPIISKSDKILGGLIFGHSKPAVFTTEHEAIAISISSQAAAALDNARLFSEVNGLSLKKDQFIARASHEIKTPLSSIQGYMQILAKDFKAGRQKLFFDKTLNQLSKLNKLISTLFDLSKISSGKMELSLEKINLKQLLYDVVENYQVLPNSTHQVILEDIVGNFTILADRQCIEQVVNNLLNNAIKYSPNSDKVIVKLAADKNEVIVHIQDFGMGIPREQLQQIFLQFYRADNLSANISGLGLGLHISKEIIDEHGGRIWANSNLGEGAIFSFALPIII